MDDTPFFEDPGTVPPGETPFFESTTPSLVVPPEVVQHRAEKYDLALGADSPGADQLASNIQTGAESADRIKASNREAVQLQALKMNVIEHMAETGQTVTPESQQFIMGLTKENVLNPDTILERQYARKAVQGALLSGDAPVLEDSLNASPEATHAALDVGEEVVARKEAFQRITEDAEATYNAANPFIKGAAMLETWVPLATSAILATADPEVTGDSILPGSIKSDIIRRLYSLPIEDAQKEFKATIDGLMSTNPLLGVEVAHAVMAYSSSSEYLDNVFGVVDIASIIPVAGVVKGAKALKAARDARDIGAAIKAGAEGPQAVKAIKDTVKAMGRRTTDPVDVLAAAGHTEVAAVQAAVKGEIAKLKEALEPIQGATKDITETVPALFRASSWAEKPGRTLSLEAQRRLADRLEETTPDLLSTLNSGIKIDRLTEGQIQAAAVDILARTKREYPHLADQIIGSRPVYAQATNTHYINVQVGDEGATLFKKSDSAIQAAQAMGLRGWRLEQQGAGFYLEIPQPVDETAYILRQVPLETDNITPRSLSNTVVGWLKSPEDILSKEANADRKVAVYGPGELVARVKTSATRIGELQQATKLGNWVRTKVGIPPKKERAELFDFIENDRVAEVTTPDGRTEVGRFASNWAEFEDRWFSQYGKPPSEKQALAYAEYVRISDLDWTFRNLGIYTGKTRLGIKSHDFGVSVTGPQGTKTNLTFRDIEAKNVEKLPYESKEDFGVLILQDSGSKFVRKSEMTDVQKELVDHLMKVDGHRLFQVPNFGEQALKREPFIADLAGEDTIHFVLSNRFDMKPLSIKQLPKRPGGHIEYPDGWYVSQADITALERASGLEHLYRGDKNVWQFTNQAKGKKYSEALDKVRLMLKNNEAGVDEFISKNLPKDPAAIKALFIPPVDEAGNKTGKALLSLDHPIALRFAGEKLADTMALAGKYANFKDARKDAFNLYSDINFEYAGKRNPLIDTVEEIGSEANPIFNLKPAKLVNAMTTLNRGMKNIIDARLLNDLKIKEVERFVREFGDQLDVDPGELARNPLQHVFNPQWKPVSGADLNAFKNQQAGKQTLLALKQFLGTETPFSKGLRGLKQHVFNSIYNKTGDGKVLEFLENHALYTTADPVKYMRSVAFHAKLGLFNPVQIFLQAQSFIHVMALAGPVHGAKAGAAYTLMRYMRFTRDPKIINAFAEKATKLGWKKEDFIEAYTHMRESGIDRIGGEVAMRDDVMDPTLVNTKMGKFGEWSTFFFNEGERSVRMSAYNAAYLEWRAAKPLAKFTNKEAKAVLARADLMSINMTRASNASWQRGFMSIPTQFFSFQARLAEQLLGKRLTGAETARALGMYSLMYGLPVGASAYTGVWPWGDTVRKELISRGIDYDDSIVTRTMMDGIASVALQSATGTKFNVGGRYGPNGINALRDWFVGSKEGSELLLGVSGTVIGDMIKAFLPVISDVAELASGNQDAYPLLLEDMLDFSKESSVGNQLSKMIIGANYHVYATKNGVNLMQVDGLEPYFAGFAGLTPQRISDTFLMGEIQREEASIKKEAENIFRKQVQRGLRADDLEDKNRYFNRGKTALESANMTHQERAKALSLALQGYKDMVTSTEFEFAKSSPARMKKYLNDKEKAQ